MPLTKIISISGKAVPVAGADMDTDRIIPARFLKCITFDELAGTMFYDERFNADGSSKGHPIDAPQHAGATIILGGENFGCGSSREHAALVPMYLGIRCVIAKSFARIHAANLINAGILPLTFADPRDYDAIEPDTQLYIYNIEEGMKQGSMTVTDQVHGFHFTVNCDMTDRQRAIVMAGGLLNYTKEGGL